MRRYIGSTTTILESIVGKPLTRLYHSKQSHYSDPNSLISFTEISKCNTETISELEKKIVDDGTNRSKLRLVKPEILRIKKDDIELSIGDRFGQILIASQEGLNVTFGERGISPHEYTNTEDLLSRKLDIPPKTLGVLNLQKHVPFRINGSYGNEAIALPLCEVERFPTYRELLESGQLYRVCELSEDDAKRVSLEVQRKIFADYSKEKFYEEVTSKINLPTEFFRSSGTLMNFESDDKKNDSTTASHYHPGERSLHIITTKKPAGVILNFCGISENPAERKDLEKTIVFPPNSFLTLNFPPYAHHKFYGDFVCNSVHTREGLKFIKAVQSGTLPGNFLDSATVFSGTKTAESKPATELNQGKEWREALALQQKSQQEEPIRKR